MKTPKACIFLVLVIVLVLIFVVKFQVIGLGGRRTLLHLSCSCHSVLFYLKLEDTFFFPGVNFLVMKIFAFRGFIWSVFFFFFFFPSVNFLVIENLIDFLRFIWSVFIYGKKIIRYQKKKKSSWPFRK